MIRGTCAKAAHSGSVREGERMAYLVQLLPQQVAEPGKALIGRSNPDRRSSISFPRAEP